MHAALLAAALSLAATPALADAVTYTGTLGKSPIVVEFTTDPASGVLPFAGRYFYVKKGIDIPLDAGEVGSGKLVLHEELPCTEELCSQDDAGIVARPPVGGTWRLDAPDDAKAITGTWTFKGKSLPISLTYFGARQLAADAEQTPMGLAADTDAFILGDKPISKDGTPYDYLRMQVPLQNGDAIKWNGSSFRYVVDPRTQFQFPTIVALAGGTDPGNADASLQQRHWSLNTDAFRCQAQKYASLGWFAGMDMVEDGDLGGYADEGIEVTFLSPAVMSWTESGSLYCGGAHPWNHHEFFNLDVATGKPLDLSLIFKGWVAKDFDGNLVDSQLAYNQPDSFQWGPDETLAAFVKAHRISDAELGLGDPNECGIDDLIDSNLAIGFKRPDHVLFALGHLDNAIEACGSDLYEAPISELRELLTPEADRYFPGLDQP